MSFPDDHGGEDLAKVLAIRILDVPDYPQPGVIACQIANFGHDETGREVVEIDTRAPWGVEAIDGTTRFHVFRDQLVELADR